MQPRGTSTRPRIPSYRHHKATGQAVVTLDGRDRYLGRYETPESRAAYDRLIASYLAGGRKLPAMSSRSSRAGLADGAEGFTVAELCDQFLHRAAAEYRRPDGSISREVENVRIALRPLLEMVFDTEAAAFGPRSLILYRQHLLGTDLSRKVINQRVGIVRRAFRWASREDHRVSEQDLGQDTRAS